MDWIHFFAHELAHLWWRGADTTSWEDWLNESLAEFSSWLFIEKHMGESVAYEVALEHENAIRACPPLRDLERNTKHAYYSRFKGAQILKDIEEQFGRANLILCMKILSQLPERSTDLWLNEISLNGKTELSDYLLEQINL